LSQTSNKSNNSTFASLNLCPTIADALKKLNYHTPTPIQSKAIPPALEGRDLLGCAQTGTGKTAAFALPILNRLTANTTKQRGPKTPRALILSPTRELASQIEKSFRTYGQFTKLRHTAIYGGVNQNPQVRALSRGVDIVVATPGRLMDLMNQRVIDLRNIEILVLDEADRMLDMGFIKPIQHIAAAIPDTRQTLLFSATMPTNIRRLADSLLTDPARISITPAATTAPKISQSVYMVQRHDKPALIQHLLDTQRIGRALVFTRTKHGADKLAKALTRAGANAAAIHGNKSQNQRQRALEAFRSGRAPILVATDVAARGLDIDDVTHVFNFDLPNEPEAYVHRIGRTGRAGAQGVAISLCDHSERKHLHAIQRLTGARIDSNPSPLAPTQPQRATHRPDADQSDSANTHSNRPAKRPQPKRNRSRRPNANAPTTPKRRFNAKKKRPAHAKR